jgi:hypothetical protein
VLGVQRWFTLLETRQATPSFTSKLDDLKWKYSNQTILVFLILRFTERLCVPCTYTDMHALNSKTLCGACPIQASFDGAFHKQKKSKKVSALVQRQLCN